MEDNLDSFIKLLKEATNTQDPKQLIIIQEALEDLATNLKANIENDENYSNKDEINKKIESLKELIIKLDTTKKFDNELFQQFKQFLDNRKIK